MASGWSEGVAFQMHEREDEEQRPNEAKKYTSAPQPPSPEKHGQDRLDMIAAQSDGLADLCDPTFSV